MNTPSTGWPWSRMTQPPKKLVRDCEEYLEEEKALELDLKEREEIIRKETPDDVKRGGICK